MRHWAEREGHKGPIALHRQSDAVRYHKINWVILPAGPGPHPYNAERSKGFPKIG